MDAFGRTYEDVSDGSTVPVYRAASATPCHNEGKEYEESEEIEYLKKYDKFYENVGSEFNAIYRLACCAGIQSSASQSEAGGKCNWCCYLAKCVELINIGDMIVASDYVVYQGIPAEEQAKYFHHQKEHHPDTAWADLTEDQVQEIKTYFRNTSSDGGWFDKWFSTSVNHVNSTSSNSRAVNDRSRLAPDKIKIARWFMVSVITDINRRRDPSLARSTYSHFCEGANIIALGGSYDSNAANIQSD